jgi:beta-glucosidase
VLSTGGPVAMPWLGKVRGVLETWLPGDAFGPAIAGMLFGDREPGGRLPVTFPVDETQGPAKQRREFPGLTDPVTGRLTEAYFDEGVFVGYRYYQAHQQKPLFPFGYGLSYGDVAMQGLGTGQNARHESVVRVRVGNLGNRPATAVPQLYVAMPEEAREPPWQLSGFAKVQLNPGETREIEIVIPNGRYWDSRIGAWNSRSGAYRLAIGRSADDLVWQKDWPILVVD